MSADTDYNGKHTIDIKDNVTYIRGRIDSLEDSMDRLAYSVSRLAEAEERRAVSDDRIIMHIKESIPIRFMVLICGIICLAFMGGGVMRELLENHVILKLFGG